MAENRDYRVRPGGLMQCCLASLDEAMADVTSVMEDASLTCKYCGGAMRFKDGAWQRDRDPLTPRIERTSLDRS